MELTPLQLRWLDSLQEMHDFMAERPDLVPTNGLTCYRFLYGSKAEFAATALQLGNAEKAVTDAWFNVTRMFGPHTLQVTQAREDVCERIVTGADETIVEEPDPEAVAALPKVQRTVRVEKVEWVCPESLHALVGSDES